MPAAESCAAWLLLALLAPVQAAGVGDAPPSAELLLHLAEFGDADDQYVEPLDLESTTTATAAATPRKRTQTDEAATAEAAPHEPDPDQPDDAPR